jgi:hypothetical protein
MDFRGETYRVFQQLYGADDLRASLPNSTTIYFLAGFLRRPIAYRALIFSELPAGRWSVS